MTTPAAIPSRCPLCLATPTTDAERAALASRGRCDKCAEDLPAVEPEHESGLWRVTTNEGEIT